MFRNIFWKKKKKVDREPLIFKFNFFLFTNQIKHKIKEYKINRNKIAKYKIKNQKVNKTKTTTQGGTKIRKYKMWINNEFIPKRNRINDSEKERAKMRKKNFWKNLFSREGEQWRTTSKREFHSAFRLTRVVSNESRHPCKNFSIGRTEGWVERVHSPYQS